MKQLFKNIFYFFCTCLLIFVFFEIILQKYNIYLADRTLARSVRYFESNSNKIEALFLGDSRIFYGIDPTKITDKIKIHNFGFVSEPIETTYYKIRYYFDEGKLNKLKLAFIVLDSSMLTLSTRTSLNTRYNYSKYYLRYFDEITDRMSTYQLIKFWFSVHCNVIRLRPLLKKIFLQDCKRLIYAVAKIKNEKEEVVEKSGYCKRTYKLSEKLSEKKINGALTELQEIEKTKYHPAPLSYYHKLINLLQQHSVMVVLIQMPNIPTKVAIEAINKKIGVDVLGDKIDTMCKKEFPNCLFLNYRDGKTKWEFSDFSDVGHLNDVGAIKLGNLIKRDLEKYQIYHH